MILLTGATGFIGSHFLKSLLERGEKVRALYRDPLKIHMTRDLLSRLGTPESSMLSQIEWFRCDILDLVRLEESFESVQGVIHCAAHVSLNRSDREKLRKVNIEGTSHIVHLCLKYNPRYLIHLSSVAALGHVKPPGLITEDTPWNPTYSSCYGWSKREAELEVWKGIQEGQDSLIVNPGLVLGPGLWKSGSPSIYHRIKTGFRYYPVSEIGLITVRTLVETTLELLDHQGFNENYILVQEHWTYKQLLETIQKAVGSDRKAAPLSIRTLKLLNTLESIRSLFGGKEVRISRDMIRSFAQPVRYSNQKALQRLSRTYPRLEQQLLKEAEMYYNGKSVSQPKNP